MSSDIKTFFVDFLHSDKDPSVFEAYEKKENGYFSAIIDAFVSGIDSIAPEENITLATLDKLHASCSAHLSLNKQYSDDNKFGIYDNWNTDKDGLSEFIHRNLRNGSQFKYYLDVINKSADKRFYVIPGQKQHCDFATGKTSNPPDNVPISNPDRLATELTVLSRDHHRVLIFFNSIQKASDKVLDAKKILDKLNVGLKKCKRATDRLNDEIKLCVLQAMKKLSQLHLYEDCNSRTYFLLSIIIFIKYRITPYHPTTQCIFDCMSDKRILQEIQQGQVRFKKLFGNTEGFLELVQKYHSNSNHIILGEGKQSSDNLLEASNLKRHSIFINESSGIKVSVTTVTRTEEEQKRYEKKQDRAEIAYLEDVPAPIHEHVRREL